MRKLGLILALVLVSGGASAQVALQANCKGNGYKFPEKIWDSGFPTKAKAQQQANTVETLGQPTTSDTKTPMKYCCSKTARPDAQLSQCPKPGSLAQKPLDPGAKNLCNHPNVSWIVSYQWVCEAGRSPTAPMRLKSR